MLHLLLWRLNIVTFVILLVAFITCIVAIKKKKLGVAFVVHFMLNNYSDHVYFVFGLSLL